jgi:hypothetical protein
MYIADESEAVVDQLFPPLVPGGID